MARINVPKDWKLKSQTLLNEVFQQQVQNQHYLWKEGAAKRELTSRILLKLTKDDPAINQLMKEAEEETLALAKQPLPEPQLTKKEVRVHPKEDFSPTSIHLTSFTPWTSNNFGFANTTPAVGFDLSTAGGDHNEACSVALGASFQPSPGSGQLTINLNATVTYSYGNHAFLKSARTHGWIGLFIAEYDVASGVHVQTSFQHQSDLWNYTHDSDVGDNLPHSIPLTATIESVPEHRYEIWLWAGGDVSSNATSYGNLKASMTDMFIRLS